MAKLRDVHQAMLEAQLEKLEGIQICTAPLSGQGGDVYDECCLWDHLQKSLGIQVGYVFLGGNLGEGSR